MRIALIGAEFEENLAVRYIWGALQRAGHEVVQVVFNDPKDLGRAARELAGGGAALAGFSMVFTSRARQFADLAERARELGFQGHIVAGGHFAAFNAEALLRDVPAVDSVAVGEGEGLMCRLAESLGDPGAVAGLVWRDASGRTIRNPPATNPAGLDGMERPVRKEPPDCYLGLPIVNMLSSRGCTHACAFCSIAAWHRLCGGDRFRLRSPDAVADEMAELYHRRGARIFNFHDDNFLLKEKAESLERAKALRRALEARGVGRVAFAIKARPDSVDEELFGCLKAMGLFRVFLGIETGTADALRKLGRSQSLSDNERALDIVNRLDLHACFNLLLLNPDSTLEDAAANVQFLRRWPENPMNFCRTEIYAGTPLEARLRGEGRLRGDYWGYDYEIADPRAQALFEILYPAFRARNYGERALHHLAMGVDYEHQLLAHFRRSDRRLRHQVKSFIREVNLNTCGHLDAIVARVMLGFADLSAQMVFTESARRKVQADNDRLAIAADDLLREIRRRARGENLSGWARAAAVAGLATGLALSGPACERWRSHPTEVAPAPSGPNLASVRAAFAEQVLPLIAGEMDGIQPASVAFTLDADGRLTGLQVNQPPFTAKINARVLALAASARLSVSPVVRKQLLLDFDANEVAKARSAYDQAHPPTQMCEMAPPRPEKRF